MDCKDLAQRVLAKASPQYAAQRFEEIVDGALESLASDFDLYRQALERLPSDELEKVNQICDLIIGCQSASGECRPEIRSQLDILVAELHAVDSSWFGHVLDVYAPNNSEIGWELNTCVTTLDATNYCFSDHDLRFDRFSRRSCANGSIPKQHRRFENQL